MLYPKINYKALKALPVTNGNALSYLINLFEDAELLSFAQEDNESGWVAVLVKFSDNTFAIYEDTFFKDRPYGETIDDAIAKCEMLSENLTAICDTREDMLRELKWDIGSYYGGQDCGWAIKLYEDFKGVRT